MKAGMVSNKSLSMQITQQKSVHLRTRIKALIRRILLLDCINTKNQEGTMLTTLSILALLYHQNSSNHYLLMKISSRRYVKNSTKKTGDQRRSRIQIQLHSQVSVKPDHHQIQQLKLKLFLFLVQWESEIVVNKEKKV